MSVHAARQISLAAGSVTADDWERLKQAGEFDPTYLHLRKEVASEVLTAARA